MSASKHLDKICCIVLCFTLVLTLLFINAENLGVSAASTPIGYENRLFDTSKVHTIDIVMDDWDSFIETCTNEEYSMCSVIIDGEAYKNVGIRAKGNTSLSSVASYGNNRYSFKIEFDQYDKTKSYHGLDKLSLNNIIQDTTYMKDYLVYQMMGRFGAAAPLCSYAYITVNGEDFGLYLAIEAVEDSFLTRNYSSNYGDLYKPDSMNMGGGRGNGKEFDREDMESLFENFGNMNLFESNSDKKELIGGFNGMSNFDRMNNSGASGGMGGFSGMGSFGHNDVSLVYSDDNHDSYSNIFDNAKTTVTDADKDRLIASIKKLNENTDIEDIVNIEEVLRYFVVHNFAVNFDSYTGSMIHNYYLYEEDGKLEMIPWDYNLAFGTFQGFSDATSLVNYPIDTPVSGGSVDSRPMLAWIFASEEYTDLYHKYFAEFLSMFFEDGTFEEMIDGVREMIAPYIEKQPTEFYTYEEFQTGIATLKDFCLLRAKSIEGQLNGTIPSTSSGQSADSTSLVDGSAVNISAMGNFEGGGFGGGFDGGGFDGGGGRVFGSSDRTWNPSDSTTDDNATSPDISHDTEKLPTIPWGDMQEGNMPTMPWGNTQEGNTPTMPWGSTQEGNMPTMPWGDMPKDDTPSTSDDKAQNSDIPAMTFPNRANGNFPSGSDRNTTPENTSSGNTLISNLILLGISMLILIGGLAFAILYGRKKH